MSITHVQFSRRFVMKKLVGLMALAIALSFGTVTFAPTYAADPAPAPAPTDEGKDKKPSGPKLSADDDKKDEKKGDKGGK
jgi:hypothetical protein